MLSTATPGESSTFKAFTDAVLDQRRITLGAGAEANAATVEIHADLLGELGIAVGQEQHLPLAAGGLGPGGEHERIVHRDASHGVDAELLELVGALDEARQMLEMTGGGEGAGHREQHDLLAAEDVACGQRLDPVGLSDPERGLRQAVSNRDGHRRTP